MTPRSKGRPQQRPRSKQRASRPSPPQEAAGRYTPTTRKVRFRPVWHNGGGGGLIAGGVTLFFAGQANAFGIHGFGGHIWYVVGLAIAASSLWWFGAFDPA